MITPTTTAYRRGRGAWLAALAPLVLSASVALATIGPKKEMQGYYQQSSNTISAIEGFVAGSCPNNTFCHVLFQRVLAGKQLVVSHASCRLFLGWPDVAGNLVGATLYPLRASGPVQRNQSLTLVQAGTNGFVVSGSTLQLFDSGDTPVIKLFTDFAANFDTVECTIAGQLFDAP